MADARFFHNAGAMTLKDMAALTGAAITSKSGDAPDGARAFANVLPLDRAGPEDVSFLDNIKYIEMFTQSKAGACFVRAKYVERAPKNMVLLVTDEPYHCYALAARTFYPDTEIAPGISPQAHIAKTATLGKGVRVEPGAVIGERVKIGDHTAIGAGAFIANGVEIGSDCTIGSNCALSHTLIGNRVILHPGVKIGQDGFGFAAGSKGILKMPQLGRVIIGDDVEIGANSCVDRGTGPDTVIGNSTKIDNLVQIAHNVHIGRGVMIAAQSGISGSTHVGDGVMIGGQVGIAGHLKIGAGAKLAAKSGVMNDIPAGSTQGGAPCVPVRDWHRQTIAVAKMAKKESND